FPVSVDQKNVNAVRDWKMRKYLVSLSFSLLFAGLLWGDESKEPAAPEQTAAPASDSPLFEKDVLPILTAKCLSCHGDKVQKAELNLATPAGVRKGSSSGPIVTSGKPDDSLLLRVLHDGLMPPPKKGEPLTSAEMELVHKWIESG